MALAVRRDASRAETGVDTRRIAETSRLVAVLTGYDVPRNKAIVGANAVAPEAGLHQDGMLKDPSTYQIVDPAVLGLSASLPLGKHSGRHAFAQACADAGLALDAVQLRDAFLRFKGLADAGAANAFEVAVS
jgi:2-isopropylmalate synthase